MNNKKILFAILLAFLFLATFSFTYAYFSLGVFGNDEAEDIIASTGSLMIVYTDGPEINEENIYPGWSTTKTFTVENTGSLDVLYSLKWDEIVNTFINEEFVMSMSCTGEGCKTISQEAIGNIAGPFVSGIPIKPGVIHTYTISLNFLELSSIQNYNQGKIFNGVIKVEESSEVVAMYGTLVDSSNVPIPNATIILHSNPQTTTTDANGNFVFNNVEVGNHTLSAKLEDTILMEDTLIINTGMASVINNTTITKTQTNNEIKVKIKIGNDKSIEKIEEVNYTLSPLWATTLGITKPDIIAIPVEITLTSPETYTYNGITYNRNKNGIDVSESSDGTVLASTYTDGTKDVIVMINSRGKTSLPEDSNLLFSGAIYPSGDVFHNLGYIQTENFNTSQVTNMNKMFSFTGYSSETFLLDLSTWDTSKVTNMSDMFFRAAYITTSFNLDLSKWNTSRVTDMSWMFNFAGYNSTIFNLDLGKWNTSKVVSMNDMFYSAGYNSTTFDLDLSRWNTSNVTDMNWMFNSAGQNATTFNLNLSTWDTSKVTNMEHMFNSAGHNATNSVLNIKKFDLNTLNTTLTNINNIFNDMNSNAQIIVGSNDTRDWILSLDPDGSNRPSSWTISNFMVDTTP